MKLTESELIHDWNRAEDGDLRPARGRVELNDETLRDGLQSPSVRTPTMEQKLAILHKMAQLGIDSANIGLPGAGSHVVESVTRLAREIADHKLPIAPNCAARTLARDIEPIIEVSQRTGIAIEVACFLGSSPIRQFAEGWEIERLVRLATDAVKLAVANQLPVMFVTEDTTRAAPADLEQLYGAAVEAGARRVCIADTVGHATPAGARRVVRFVRSLVDRLVDPGSDRTGGVQVDWHGHRDRGLAVINSLAAAAAGADRLHGTALGIGERCGNTAIDLLMVNLCLLGWIERDLSALPAYCRLVSEATGAALPDNYPVLGRDAFRTATGVHASAILKARAKGDAWLADRIYSGVPAALLGLEQKIEIGPMSGKSNIVYWLERHGGEPRSEVVEALFARAKSSETVLAEDEIRAICRERGLALDG